MMNTIKDPIRAGRSYWAMLLLSLLCITTVWAQTPTLPASPTACDYTSEPANISLTAQNVPAGYNTLYLLVNMTSGMIVQTNATAPVFNGVSRGLYYAVAAHYSSSLNNASTGKLISDVYALDECLTYGPALGLRVCSSACDYAIPPSSVTFTAQNVPPGVSTTYTLVDEATNLIVQTSATASFSGVATGDYAITSVHYTGSLTALAAGNRLYDVTTENANCLSVSNTLHIKVCNNPIAITGPPNGGTVASLNPPISGTASPGASVTVTGGPGSTGGPCIATADLNGNWSCTSLTFTSGPASVTATDGTTTAVSSFTAAPLVPPTVAILSPATNGTATTTPTISGTATPNAVVTLTGGPGSTGGPVSVTADPTGAFSTSALTFPAGPASVTAVAVTPGGSSTPAVDNFTVVGPPSLTVTSPVSVSTTTTPVIAGTATPGSLITITGGPGNTTLCTTTASVSGTFACALSTPLPTGPNTLTVTASGPGGSTSVPVTFTSVAVPTVAILSPTTNGTATTTPTISGTATPNAVVTLTGGPGSTGGPVSVTAGPTGVYSNSAITFPAGLASVTAVASNPGGNSTPAVDNFTVVSPPSLTVATPPTGGTTQPIAGTATPGSVITITGPGNATLCTTTASLSGTFSCPVTVPTGPSTLTVTASDPGGTTSVPVSVSALPVPTVAVISPANNGTATTTPTVSGTATPGSAIVITGPGNATLCTTTASVSGSYACALSTPLPTGPNTLTVTASNPGGSTSVPVTFTVIAPCVTATVGGSVTLLGTLPLCSISNAGSLTLTGQTGNVLRWETSTDNGANWVTATGSTTTATLNFANAANNQQFRAVVNNGASCATANSTPITTTTSASACSADCTVLPDTIVK